MPKLVGNNAYLSWDGVDVSGWWTGEISREPSVETIDVTAGAGVNYMQREPGLIDNSMGFSIYYDDTDLASYVGKLAVGTKAILIYGPENNTAGKPKFEGSMILESVSQGQVVTKDLVKFELSFVQADAPTATIEGGSTF